MSGEPRRITGRAEELRLAFDRSFAAAPSAAAEVVEDLLEIRLGSSPYALRVNEVAGLFLDVKITPVPTSILELLGIGAFRGGILPVYDLHALLGHSLDAPPRWIATTAGAPVALAFGGFERQLRVRQDAVFPDARGGTAARHVRQVVQIGNLVRPILSIASVLEAISLRARAAGFHKE